MKKSILVIMYFDFNFPYDITGQLLSIVGVKQDINEEQI